MKGILPPAETPGYHSINLAFVRRFQYFSSTPQSSTPSTAQRFWYSKSSPLGIDVVYDRASATACRPYGVPKWQLNAWVSTYTTTATGGPALVTDAVQPLIGNAPLDLADVLGQSSRG